MKKSGDVRISYLIGGIIFLVLLVIIVSCYSVGYCGSVLQRFKILIPNFNFEDKQDEKSSLIVGYNVMQNKPKYYEGEKWLEFPEIIKTKKGKISSENLRKQFVKFYYFDAPRETQKIKLSVKASDEIYNKDPLLPGLYCIKLSKILLEKTGDLIFNYKDRVPDFLINLVIRIGGTCTDDEFGSLILLSNNELIFYGIDKEKYIENREIRPIPLSNEEREIFDSSQVYSEVVENTKKWLESGLVKPMPLKFDDSDKIYYFCVEQFDIPNSIILTIDLFKEVDKDALC